MSRCVRDGTAAADGAAIHARQAMNSIVLLAGVCTRHDAISNVVRMQERVLRRSGYDVTVISHHSDFLDDDHVEATDPWILQRNETYRSADLVILHYGIQYGLFDSLLLSHSGRRVVHFHNVTPPELLDGRPRQQALKAVDQIAIAEQADAVWSDSTHNTGCLLEWTSVDPARIRPMELSVSWEVCRPERSRRAASEQVELLYVGRFSSAKSPSSIVDAVARLPAAIREGVRLRMIGSSTHSDPSYIESLRRQIESAGVHASIELDVPDSLLRLRYQESDIFVTASLHEGFCVPVIEALAAGCRVVATDAGALRETVGPGGCVVPVGDEVALSAAILDAVERARSGALFDSEEASALEQHLRRFSEEAGAERLLDAVERELDSLVRDD